MSRSLGLMSFTVAAFFTYPAELKALISLDALERATFASLANTLIDSSFFDESRTRVSLSMVWDVSIVTLYFKYVRTAIYAFSLLFKPHGIH